MRILNFGSLNWDKTYRVPHFVRGGETICALALTQSPGGKGLNQSVALGRAGADVAHAGAVGADGAPLRALLEAAGADASRLRTAGKASGHAVIQLCGGENCIIVYGGANRTLAPADVDAFLAGYGPGDLLLVQNETSCVPYAMRRAKAQGMAVALNPSPIDETLTPDVLALADVLFVNETEAGALTGADAQDADALLRALAARFPAAQLVLTLGEKGAAYQSGGARLYQRAYPVTAADTTAAGDTFTGFFLAAMARNLPPKTCLRCAALAAALAVSRPGAADSIPTWAQMKAFGEASGEDMQRL